MSVLDASDAAADCTVANTCNLRLLADRQAVASSLDDIQTASVGQVTDDPTFSGVTAIVVETDGSGTDITLNGRGLTCSANVAGGGQDETVDCDSLTGVAPNATDHQAVFLVADVGSHSVGDTLVVTATQDAVTLDSETITVVGQAHDIQLVVTKPTIQEAAASCDITDSTSAPTRGGAATIYTDIDGTALVGYWTQWGSSNTSILDVALSGASEPTPSMLLPDGKTVAAGNVYCGDTAGTANLTAKNLVDDAIAGVTGQVTRTQAITVTGVPASVVLTASPAAIACDGTATSTVTAKVTDSAGNDVVDNTPVTFNVVALGTANPISAKTTGGSASSTITPLSGGVAGVTVVVQAGDVQTSTRIDCLLPTPTTPPVPVATATPPVGITPPVTGTGGYLGQDGSAGFPTWTLIALALGSVALVAGGMVTRRAGK